MVASALTTIQLFWWALKVFYIVVFGSARTRSMSKGSAVVSC